MRALTYSVRLGNMHHAYLLTEEGVSENNFSEVDSKSFELRTS